MGPLLTVLIICLAVGGTVGLGFLLSHLLSSESTVESTGCKTNSNCSGTTPHCQSGKCVQCASNTHCSGSKPRCDKGVCVAGCLEDSECKQGEECENGKCVPIPCTATSGCAAPLVCKDGKCTLECSQSSECKENEECKANRCVAQTCANTSECTPPLTCKEGTCQRECTLDAQCGAGKVCDGGVCETNLICSKQTDCGVGEVCNQGSCSRSCFDNSVCPAGSSCVDGLCLRTRLPCPTGSTNVRGSCVKKVCMSDVECAGWKCNQGRCEPFCQADWDCPNGQCREGKCITNVLPDCLFNQWDGERPLQYRKCAWIYEANSGTAPNAADQRFLMFDGNVDKIPCLERCIRHRDCAMVWFDDKKVPNQCKLYSKGVNTSRVGHPTGTTARKTYQKTPP